MELFETLLVTFFAGGAPAALWAALQFLLHLLANVTLIKDPIQRSALDRYIAKHGWCSARVFDYSGLPSNGIHVVITRCGYMPTGIMVAHKWTEDGYRMRYTLYWIGPGIKDLRREIIGNPDAITIVNVNVASPTRINLDISRIMPPAKEKAWQKAIVDQIASAYTANGRASHLICGHSGCGKSTLGELVAKRLAGIGVAPEVIKNVDFTTPGLLLEDMFDSPTRSAPVILMLDEFDGAVKYAERDTSKTESNGRESIALANTPTLLLSTMDRMARTMNLIVIATSNMPLEKMRADVYMRYTRVGRLDRWHQVSGAANTTA